MAVKESDFNDLHATKCRDLFTRIASTHVTLWLVLMINKRYAERFYRTGVMHYVTLITVRQWNDDGVNVWVVLIP